MKYIALLFFVLVGNTVLAQFNFLEDRVFSQSSQLINQGQESFKDIDLNMPVSELSLLTINTTNPYFQRSFLIQENGTAISSGFSHSAYFRPNNNKVIITGRSNDIRNSFNPYGATDLTSVVFLSTVNTFISRIRIRNRSKVF